MEKVERKKLISSAIFMYILSFTKLVVPLISLPYLTRVLSVDVYGSISFVKSLITYLQVLVDFGFIYSGTRDIVNLIKGKEDINKEISSIAFSPMVCLPLF